MEDELLKIIQDVEREKIDKCHTPTHAMFIRDIMPLLRDKAKEVLNKLVKDKKITWVKTINDDAFNSADNEK